MFIRHPFTSINPIHYEDIPPNSPKDDKLAPAPSLKDIIKDAADKGLESLADSELKNEKDKKDEKPKDDAKDDKKDDKKDEKKDEDKLTDEEQKFVTNLYKGLNNKDPEIQKATLKLLARSAGMDLTEIKTEKQAEKAEETLLELLKSGLGEYDFLAEKLGPVLEKAFEKYVNKHTQDIREELKADKEKKQLTEIQNDLTSVVSEYSNATELIPNISALMELYRPSNKVSSKSYFKSLLVIAANEKGIELKPVEPKAKEKDDRIKKNRDNAHDRLGSERNAEPKDGVRVPSKMSLKDIVRESAEQAAEELTNK